MTKPELERMNDRLILALSEILRDWEVSRDLRESVERAKVVLDDARAARAAEG